MMASIEDQQDDVFSSFRPAKRHKSYRKRSDNAKDDISVESSTTVTTSPPQNDATLALPLDPGRVQDDQVKELSIADLLRLRKSQQRRRHGIEFGASKVGVGPSDSGATNVESGTRDVEQTASLQEVNSRFAQQTGQAVSTDKHMMAYIDAHLPTLLDPKISSKNEEPDISDEEREEQHKELDLEAFPDKRPRTSSNAQRQPASMGKLLEIDLSSGISQYPEEQKKPARKKRVRLGRNGKPLPDFPRRSRRGSDDVRRDQLVEDLLRENRLDIYEAAESSSGQASSAKAGNDLAADERMAAEFRAEFMDALQARRQAAQPQKSAAGAKGKEEERLKGPKLGGSRSQRAVLREKELEVQREKDRAKLGKR